MRLISSYIFFSSLFLNKFTESLRRICHDTENHSRYPCFQIFFGCYMRRVAYIFISFFYKHAYLDFLLAYFRQAVNLGDPFPQFFMRKG